MSCFPADSLLSPSRLTAQGRMGDQRWLSSYSQWSQPLVLSCTPNP